MYIYVCLVPQTLSLETRAWHMSIYEVTHRVEKALFRLYCSRVTVSISAVRNAITEDEDKYEVMQ